MNNQCSTESGCCETDTRESSCAPEASCCPIEKATELWKASFFTALKEVKTEILKEKIRKAWGSKLDKAADAVLEASETEWQAQLSAGKAKMGLKEKIAAIFTEGKK